MVQRSRTMMLPWKVLFSSIFLLSSSVVFQGHHFFVLSLSAPGSMSLEEIATQLSESSFCNVVVLVGAGLSICRYVRMKMCEMAPSPFSLFSS